MPLKGPGWPGLSPARDVGVLGLIRPGVGCPTRAAELTTMFWMFWASWLAPELGGVSCGLSVSSDCVGVASPCSKKSPD